MRIQDRRIGMGLFLGLLALLGIVGCSETTGPEHPGDVPSLGVETDLNSKLPSSDEIGQAAGEAAESVAEGVSAAWEKSASAMKNFEGGQEMLSSMKEMYGSAKASLSDVASEESAQKAKAELNKISEKLEEWKPKLSEMSEDTKVGIKRFFEYVANQLSSMGDRLNENEWVNEILKPKLRAVIEQLKTLV